MSLMALVGAATHSALLLLGSSVCRHTPLQVMLRGHDHCSR